MGSKVVGDFRLSRRRTLPAAILRMLPSFFLMAVRLAEKNGMQTK